MRRFTRIAGGVFPVVALQRCFNIKQHEMEKRRRRELERAGIDPDDDTPWVDEQTQAEMDEAAANKKREEEERARAMMETRDKEDAIKRQKFKEFRAQQLKQSRQQRDLNQKSHGPSHGRQSRFQVDDSLPPEEPETAPTPTAAPPQQK